MNKPIPLDYDKNPCPNPNPSKFHGCWTDWPEEHDQKSLDRKATYMLQDKGRIPESGKAFFVEQPHPSDGGSARLTMEIEKARKFRGTYLLRTMWNWELRFTAIKV